MKNFIFLIVVFFCVQTSFAQTVTIPDTNLKSALLNYSPPIDTNNDGEIQVSEAQAVTGVLDLNYKQISNVTGIGSFTNITELILSNNEFTSFPVINTLTNLEVLYLIFNDLSSINLSGFTSLETANLGYNEINAISDSDLPSSLTTLWLSGNNLTTFTSQLPNLESLRVKDNDLSSIDISALTQIESLNLKNNAFSSLSAMSLPSNLTSLNVSSNSISTVSSSEIPSSIVDLSLVQNQISSVNLQASVSLDSLDLGFNNLTTFDASNCPPNLTSLSLYGNSMTSVDVSTLTQLETLNIAGNFLASIDLSNNMNLKYLKPNANPFTELDVSNNPNLEGITLMDMEDLTYLNLKNGNNQNMYSVEPFNNMPNVEYVCVDDLDTFFDNLYMEEWMGDPWFTVSTNCDFDPGEINTITGVVTYDYNGNCSSQDANNFPNILVKTEVGNASYGTLTDSNGNYTMHTDAGQNTVSVANSLPSYFQLPASQTINFSGYGNTGQVDFCLSASSQVNDLNITVFSENHVNPGNETDYKIVYENVGTTTLTGQLTFQYDGSLQTYVSASENPASTASNTLTFDYTAIQPFQQREIEVTLQNQAPPTLDIGDMLSVTVEIPVNDDNTPDNNSFELDQSAINSYDPNDKRVLEGDEIADEDTGKYLHYIIRFQNTGTANAQNVVVTDTLSDNLDWNSLKMVSASDGYHVKIENGNAVEFSFNGIDLPFEDADEAGSHGYIAYKIKPKNDIQIGDVISGDAEIYFDFNPPILTNNATTTVVDQFSVGTHKLHEIKLYPNPTSGTVNISTGKHTTLKSVSVFSISGRKILQQEAPSTLDLGQLSNGVYFVKLLDTKGNQTVKKVVKQ